MKRIVMLGFLIFLLVIIVQVFALQKVILLHTDIYRNDQVTLRDIKIIEGIPDVKENGEGSYSIVLLSEDNSEVFRTNFDVEFVAYEENNLTGGETELEYVSLFLRLPYFVEANSLKLYHDDKLIFETNLPKENICGNNICEQNENIENCYRDCRKKSNVLKYILVVLGVIATITIIWIVKK